MLNKRNIFKLFLIILVISIYANSPVFSQVTIGGTSGTFINGGTVIINGNGFGTKLQASPISWDDFEAQTNGNEVRNTSPVIGPNWTTQYGPSVANEVEIAYSDQNSHSGSMSIKVEWATYSIRGFGWSNQGPYNKLYISFWAYQHWKSGLNNSQLIDDIKSCNRKWLYVFGNSPKTGGNACNNGNSDCPQFMPLIPAGNSTYAVYNNGGNTEYNGLKFEDTHDVWQRWEFYIELNEPYTSSNGVVRFWHDNILLEDISNYKHRYTNNEWDDIRIGNMWQGYQNGDPPYAYFDDVFIDTTQARVEIGDASTFSACTLREIQIPSSWSDTSINFIVNQGIFNDGETAYLFVVDSAGNTSVGYPLAFGGGDTTPPGKPAKPVNQ